MRFSDTDSPVWPEQTTFEVIQRDSPNGSTPNEEREDYPPWDMTPEWSDTRESIMIGSVFLVWATIGLVVTLSVLGLGSLIVLVFSKPG